MGASSRVTPSTVGYLTLALLGLAFFTPLSWAEDGGGGWEER